VLDIPNLGVGMYWFQLVVDEQDGPLSSTASTGYTETQILEMDGEGKVLDALPTAYFSILDENRDPFEAGVKVPTSGKEINLDGSASSARRSGEEVELEHVWSCLDCETGDLIYRPFAEEPYILNIANPIPGSYTFSLVVKEKDTNRASMSFMKTIVIGTENNWIPVADAGDDKRLDLVESCDPPKTYMREITLDGSGSNDREQQSLTYEWRQVGGLMAPLKDVTTDTPSFIAFQPGLYTFELVVSDGVYDSEPDMVTVAVTKQGTFAPNIFPASNPRYDTITHTLTVDPGAQAVLDLSPTTDPDTSNDNLEFSWHQIDGPASVLSSWTDDVVAFWPDVTDVLYRFEVVVWDSTGNPSLPFEYNVNVLSKVNVPPDCSVVDVELEDVTGNFVDLDASPTFDPDPATTLTYSWTQVQVGDEPMIGISNATQKIATVQPTISGLYTFEFTASDGVESCEPIVVTLNATANTSPTAVAKAKKETVCFGETIELDGTGSYDSDMHPITYRWIVRDAGGTGHVTEDLKPDNKVASPTLTPISEGTIIFHLFVNDGFENGESLPDQVSVQIDSQACITDGDVDGDEEEEIVCIDEDDDGCCKNIAPIDPDDTDETVTAPGCGDADGDDDTPAGGGGGGCQQNGSSLPFGAIAFLLVVGVLARRRLRKVRAR